jgi:hypothetical protein
MGAKILLALKIAILLFVLIILVCIPSCFTKEEKLANRNKVYVDEIRVLTIDGDTAIINRGIGTTMTIEIK